MLFELFGTYSAEDSVTVRATAITEVEENYEWYDKASYILNIIKSTDLDSWLNIMKYEGIRGDEITIYALSKKYQRHVVVYTKNRPWTTIKPDGTLNEDNLWEMCDVHLLYLGQHVYAELKRKPFEEITKRTLMTDPRMQLVAIKSYQTDGEIGAPVDLSSTVTNIPPVTDTSTKITNKLAPKPNTCVSDAVAKVNYGQPVFPAAKQILPLHSGFSDEDSSEDELPDVPSANKLDPSQSRVESVEAAQKEICNTNTRIMVREPDIITNDCKVILRELNEDEINLWTKKDVLPEFPDFETGRNVGGHNIRPKTLPVRYNTRPMRSNISVNYQDMDDNSDTPSPKRPRKKAQPVKKDGPSDDRIAAREYSLRNKTTTTASKEDNQKVLMSTDNEIDPDVLVKTKPKGKFVLSTHGVKVKKPKLRNFKCPDCEVVEHTRKELNTHFKKSHHKLFCEECGQMFHTPSALDRHMYLHTKEDQHPCKHCDEVFPFQSDLQIHTIKHLTSAGYQCGHGGCLKWFKRKGERDKHARTHDGPDLNCDQCDYITKDIRNLRRHQTSHSDYQKLVCDKCGEQFKWHMQRKRHIESKKCKPAKRSNSPDF